MTTAQANTWQSVQSSAQVTRCKCKLTPGMNRTALVALGGGCKMPSFACPTLDKYRRLTPADREAAQGWTPADSQVHSPTK